jgi:hypothetical protein
VRGRTRDGVVERLELLEVALVTGAGDHDVASGIRLAFPRARDGRAARLVQRTSPIMRGPGCLSSTSDRQLSLSHAVWQASAIAAAGR